MNTINNDTEFFDRQLSLYKKSTGFYFTGGFVFVLARFVRNNFGVIAFYVPISIARAILLMFSRSVSIVKV